MKRFLPIVFTLFAFVLWAEESAPELPLKPTMYFNSIYQYDTKGDSLAGMNWAEGDQYVRNEIMGGLIIDAYKNDSFGFVVMPWARDRFDLRIFHPDTISVRNRLFVGSDFSFSVNRFLKITLTPELRFESDFTLNNHILRITPAELTVAMNFDWGFNFLFKHLTGIHLFMNSGLAESGDTYRLTEIDNTISIGFNVFRYIPVLHDRGISGNVYLKNWIVFLVFPTDGAQSRVRYHDMTAGFSFSISGFKPYIAYYLSTQYSMFDNTANNVAHVPVLNLYNGFETGMSFTKDWFEVGFSYLGRTMTTRYVDGAAVIDLGVIAARNAAEHGAAWESHVSGYIRFKM